MRLRCQGTVKGVESVAAIATLEAGAAVAPVALTSALLQSISACWS